MAVLQGNAKQGSTRGFYPKTIEGSLRFNDDDSAYLTWTPDSAGDQKTWTWSGWVKRSQSTDANGDMLFSGYVNDSNRDSFGFATGIIQIFNVVGGSVTTQFDTSQVFRDHSSWYHVVISIDTTQATESNRLKIYVNGTQITSFSTANYPSQNEEFSFNGANVNYLGVYGYSTLGGYFDGYLAEVHFTDGTAYTADAFGEFKENIWVAKAPSVTYGTNGFYLNFQDDTEVEAFNTVLYRGTGTEQSITGMGFQPDLVWIKLRNSVDSHALFDPIRGVTQRLEANNTSAEANNASILYSFDSDGFTVGTSGQSNGSGNSYVAWGWKAGDSNVSNTDGSITSTVRANDTYGFSIVSWTGTGANATVGHGLSSAPDFMIFKSRSTTTDWTVYHKDIGATGGAYLDLTGAAFVYSPTFNDTAPTTSVFSVGSSSQTNPSSQTMITYCWAEKTGYSKFGSYSGDNSTDGSNEITVGFKPAFVIIKNTGAGENWNIYDNTRFTDGDGYIEGNLFASSSSAEVTTAPIEFTDTGFAPRASGGGVNASGSTYIYAAFADTREAAFWLDQSGNDNDWQPVNLDHNDTVADSPTDNFATWNPLFRGGEKSASIAATTTLSDGNLKASVPTNSYMGATMRPTSGQWYCEATIDTVTLEIGWGWIQATEYSATTAHAGQANKWGAEYSGYAPADIFLRDETTAIAQPTITLANGDVIQWAWDIDNGKGWLGVNNSWYDSSGGTTGNPATGSNPTFTFTADEAENLQVYVANGTGTAVFTANFGQQPFKYDPPA